jgi:hypothetical protein
MLTGIRKLLARERACLAFPNSTCAHVMVFNGESKCTENLEWLFQTARVPMSWFSTESQNALKIWNHWRERRISGEGDENH